MAAYGNCFSQTNKFSDFNFYMKSKTDDNLRATIFFMN